MTSVAGRFRRRTMARISEGDVMVRRDKVVDARGRSWVSGKLGSEEYFAEARRIARDQARRPVRAPLTRPTARRATPPPPPPRPDRAPRPLLTLGRPPRAPARPRG